MNVLFLSVSIGYGHHKAAEAIREEILTRYPQAKAEVVDVLKYINPILDKLVVSGYLNTIKATPLLYKKLYELTDASGEGGEIGKRFNRLLAFRLRRLIRGFEPDLIVCTHPFAVQMLQSLKKKADFNIPVIGIVTDFTAHGFWIAKNIDAYVVATESVKREMVRKGVEQAVIHPLGIPVVASFYEQKDKEMLRKELKLNSRLKTVLLMGGSLGIGELGSIINELIELDVPLQIIFVAGRNQDLKERMERIAQNCPHKLLVFGFTDRIAELMTVSDILISKPGGMTVSEALCKKLPIIMTSPIPGHEESNARFLVNNGLAAWIFREEETVNVIEDIFLNPERFLGMQQMADYFSRPNATKDTVNMMERLWQK